MTTQFKVLVLGSLSMFLVHQIIMGKGSHDQASIMNVFKLTYTMKDIKESR